MRKVTKFTIEQKNENEGWYGMAMVGDVMVCQVTSPRLTSAIDHLYALVESYERRPGGGA